MSQNDENFKPQEVDPSCGNKNDSRVVRNIPIFLEDRNETIMNDDKTDSSKSSSSSGNQQGQQFPTSKFNSNGSSKSLFDRVKDIPVRNFIPSFETRRSASPGQRFTTQHSNIPQTKTSFQQSSSTSSSSSASSGHKDEQQHEKFSESHHHQQNTNNRQQDKSEYEKRYQEQLKQYQQQRSQQFQQEQQNRNIVNDEKFTKPQFNQKPNHQPINDPIAKINAILKEVTMLSDQVKKFPYGLNRKSKDYLYLDEMLTQNLLKLDTIDTEGKDDIKAFRKDVINCINKNISNLESKVSSLSVNEPDTTTPSSESTEIK